MPLLDQIRENKLIELAKARFDAGLMPAELKVLHDSASSGDPPKPDGKAPRPEVRADFLRWLATDQAAAPHIDPKGLRVCAATISEKLNLANCRITTPLHFRWCSIKGEIILKSAKTLGLSLKDTSVEGMLCADWIDARGPVLFRLNRFAGKISLIGARIKNDLNLSGSRLMAEGGDALIAATAEIGGSVFLEKGVKSSGTISLHGARIKNDLNFSGARLLVKGGDALIADSVQIGGNVFLNKHFRSLGVVRLVGARIKGHLVCSGAKLEVKEGNALMLDSAEIEGSALLRNGFTSSGLVSLGGARIKGDLSFTGAKLKAREGGALLADGAEIGGNVLLRGCFESSGTVRLVSTRVGGDLDFLGAKVAEVNCKNLRLSNDLLWMGIRRSDETSLNLAGAELKNLREDKESWPKEGDLVLEGLIYEEIALHQRPTEEEIKNFTEGKNPELTKELELNVEDRIAWLMRQPEDERTQPQPWMQLSNHLEAKGDHKESKHIIYKFRCLRAHAQKRWWISRGWAIAFAWLEEAPVRILWSIAATLLLGWLTFGYAGANGAIAPTDPEAYKAFTAKTSMPDAYPTLNPFVYTLENAVPLVKLGQDEKWAPDRRYPGTNWFTNYWFLMWFRWLLILFGWFQAAVLGAALLRRFKE